MYHESDNGMHSVAMFLEWLMPSVPLSHQDKLNAMSTSVWITEFSIMLPDKANARRIASYSYALKDYWD